MGILERCSPPSGCGVRSTSTTSSCRSPSTAPGRRGTRTLTTARGKLPRPMMFDIRCAFCAFISSHLLPRNEYKHFTCKKKKKKKKKKNTFFKKKKKKKKKKKS